MTQKKKKLNRKAISWKRLGRRCQVKHKKVVQTVNRTLGLTWNKRCSLRANYADLGLKAGTAVSEPTTEPLVLTEDDFGGVDEALSACAAELPPEGRGEAVRALECDGRTRVVKVGKKPVPDEPRKKECHMTIDDQLYWSRLLAKHGSDYRKMQLDSKLNPMQYSAQKCRLRCEQYMATYAAPIVRRK